MAVVVHDLVVAVIAQLVLVTVIVLPIAAVMIAVILAVFLVMVLMSIAVIFVIDGVQIGGVAEQVLMTTGTMVTAHTAVAGTVLVKDVIVDLKSFVLHLNLQRSNLSALTHVDHHNPVRRGIPVHAVLVLADQGHDLDFRWMNS